ncbi:MAG TPA: hypothetical protein VMT24_04755 [Aggregatilineaceae bacterium]|nr:hypothetical protein [Aggregatilineaceae bacterium]
MSEIALENLKHLVDQISLKDLERLTRMEQAARQEKEPAPAEAARSRRMSTLRDLRQLARGSGGDERLHLQELRGLAQGAACANLVVSRSEWIQPGQLEKLWRLTEMPAEEEEKRPSLTPGDLWKSIYATLLAIALYPERAYNGVKKARRDFAQLPGLVRGVMLIAFALVLLTGATYTVGAVIRADIRAQQGPFLAEALVPPYDLNARPVPPISTDARSLLAATLGPYQRTDLPITTDSPSSPTNQCLLGLGYARDVVSPPYCKRTYGPTSVAAAKYQSGYQTADLAIARFSDESQAGRTMEELLAHARAYGRVGNFVAGGVGEVEFFFSSVRGWVSLTWSHGPWVYSISAAKFANLEEMVGAFPY